MLIVVARPDDADVQMDGTFAKLTRADQHALTADLYDGQPAEDAEPGMRRAQAMLTAQILGADRVFLDQQDRFISDTIPTRLAAARLVQEPRPCIVFATTDARIPTTRAGGSARPRSRDKCTDYVGTFVTCLRSPAV